MSPLSHKFSVDSRRIRKHVPGKHSTREIRCLFFSPPPPFSSFKQKIVKCTYLFCFRFPTKRPSGSPLYTCSGKVAVINPRDIVHILDEREYRVLQIYPHSSTVVLRRVDATSNQRSFMRPSTSVCLVPSSTRDASVECNEPTSNCMYELSPPQFSRTLAIVLPSVISRIFAPSLHNAILKEISMPPSKVPGLTVWIDLSKAWKKPQFLCKCRIQRAL